jgi:hypothetical protein
LDRCPGARDEAASDVPVARAAARASTNRAKDNGDRDAGATARSRALARRDLKS